VRALSIDVYGRVQGVGFRFFIYKKALECNVKGFVKNMPDGSVSIEVQGDEDDINRFLVYCHQGPPMSRVTEVKVGEIPPQDFGDFTIKR